MVILEDRREVALLLSDDVIIDLDRFIMRTRLRSERCLDLPVAE